MLNFVIKLSNYLYCVLTCIFTQLQCTQISGNILDPVNNNVTIIFIITIIIIIIIIIYYNYFSNILKFQMNTNKSINAISTAHSDDGFRSDPKIFPSSNERVHFTKGN